MRQEKERFLVSFVGRTFIMIGGLMSFMAVSHAVEPKSDAFDGSYNGSVVMESGKSCPSEQTYSLKVTNGDVEGVIVNMKSRIAGLVNASGFMAATLTVAGETVPFEGKIQDDRLTAGVELANGNCTAVIRLQKSR